MDAFTDHEDGSYYSHGLPSWVGFMADERARE